ncbi:MAG: BrnA antitoxin family protein [Sphingomonadaceae bacterium]
MSEKSTESTWVDPDDAPELDDEWFEKADLMIGDKVIRPGNRPGDKMRWVSLRLDDAVLEHFRSAGPNWKARINEALRRAAGLES